MAAVEMETPMPRTSFTAEDFETASIRSAAPSYISEAPSYHTTVSNHEPIPDYSPPSVPSYASINNSTSSADGPAPPASPSPPSTARTNSTPTLLPSSSAHLSGPGLPPIPPIPRRATDVPSLSTFRIPPWSTVNANPTYHRVASRRAQAAREGLLSAARVLERVDEGSSSSGSDSPGGSGVRVRPLEDPYLVGEVAAARARRERLARENGDAILLREDRRWDWFLSHMKDMEERERSWKQFRRELDNNSRGKLAHRIGAFRPRRW